ncbi:MAG: DUF4251 domain-containing protein [Chitinophagales bacterium]
MANHSFKHTLGTMLRYSIPILMMVQFAGVRVLAQDSDKEKKEAAMQAAVKSLIESKHYLFTPQSMMPMKGRSRPLSSTYEVRITGDTMLSYLPYVGRSYVAGYGDSDGAIDFKSTSFDYSSEPAKKGGWNITIAPKKISNVSKFMFNISETGHTTLVVTSNTRDQITFYGAISALN